ncbi:hypothetical protein DL767_010064 [Monosporascus sp. MG133]|nr:hypothetical protein DL767_010064 [Monosporascus sp. MG133]
METRRFTPSPAYIDQASNDNAVRNYLEIAGLGAKVFVITGIKTAMQIEITTTDGKQHETAEQLGVDVAAAQLTAGPKGSYSTSKTNTHTTTIKGPIVFAIQVEKLRLGKWSNRAVSKEHIAGAMLGTRGSEKYIIERAAGDLEEGEIEDFGARTRQGVDEETPDQGSVMSTMTSASGLSQKPEEVSIRHVANAARQLLICCADIREEEVQRIAQIQLERFNLWASNIGVFAHGHASLDHRLRAAPTAKAAVEAELEALCERLLTVLNGGSDILDDELDEFAELEPSKVDKFAEKLMKKANHDPDDQVHILGTVVSMISALHRISLSIRKASNRNSLAKIPELFDEDDDGASSLGDTAASELQTVSIPLRTPSNVSPSTTASSEGGELRDMGSFEFPPPPDLKKWEREKACPYCCLVLPQDTYIQKKGYKYWRRHLVEDTQPYICLFRHCNAGGKTYRTFTEWQTHLKRPHFESWTCPLEHEGEEDTAVHAFAFESEADCEAHLDFEHLELEDEQVRDVLRTAGQQATLPRQCFVCFKGFPEATDLVAVQRHVASHLQVIFLLALPWVEDVESENAAFSNNVNSSAGSDVDDLHDIEIGELQSKRLAKYGTPSHAYEPHFMLPFGRNEDFVGRESILQQLLQRIPPNENEDDCQRTAIEGLGGVGKTQIAIEAAYRVRDKHPKCSIFWVPAMDSISFEKAYREIGRQLGLKDIDEDETDIKPLVQIALSRETVNDWLLIGKYEEAEQMHRQALELRKAVLGGEHPDTLASINNLALVLNSQGKYEEAEQMHRQALKLRKAVVGGEHPDTLASINNLALVLNSQG